jgi:putative ABC transport system permease protein
MDQLLQDLAYGFRSFRRNSGFTLAALAVIGLGIGATTAIFTVVNAVELQPLNAPNEDRMVRITTVYSVGANQTATLPHFNVLRDQQGVFDSLAAHRLDLMNLTGGATPEPLMAGRVTASFFPLFAAPVVLGRSFSDEDDRPRSARAVVLSHGLWTRRFGADPDAIGQVLVLGGEPYTVVGVIGPQFNSGQFERPPDVWIAFQIDPDTQDRGGEFCQITARLAPGVTFALAQGRLDQATADYQRRFPNRTAPSSQFTMLLLRDALAGRLRPSLILLSVAVSLVLLVACANLSTLLLARGTSRRRELAIRTAMGAGRGRLMRQLLTESLLLSTAGGLVGLGLGVAGVRALLLLYPGSNPLILAGNGFELPRVGEHGADVILDWRVLLFTVLVSVLAGLLFGTLPALIGSRSGSVNWLQAGPGSGGPHQHRLRWILTATELAVAVMLLVGAGLLVRTWTELRAVDTGFDPQNVLTLRMSVTATAFERRDGIERLTREGIAELRSTPGVVAASTACCVPLETVWQLPFIQDGGSSPRQGLVGWTFISPGYFQTMRIPILRGRDFSERDTSGAPGAVIINAAMARRYWPDADPMGDSIRVGRGVRPDYDADPVRRIIGIVGDIRDSNLTRSARPAMYVPVAQVPDGVTVLNVRLLPLTWIVRTDRDPHHVRSDIEAALERVSGLPIARARTLDEVMREATMRSRFEMWLMSIFAILAVVLAAVGLYGSLSFSIEQRTPEIGIRFALGANTIHVRDMLVRQAMSPALAGIVLGVLMAFGFARLLAGFLFGVTPRDPVVFVSVPLLLAAVALFSAVVPALRATRISPSAALRHD